MTYHAEPPSSHTIADLVGRLDLHAKAELLTGASLFTLAGNATIGLAPIGLSDGASGVRGLKLSGERPVALLPNATLQAAAWSTELTHQVGRIIAEEAVAQQVSVVLGPVINLHRSVLGGRLFEAYSEDPLLTGKLAAAYVSGLQSAGVAACLKHIVANESETDRDTMNSVLSDATLRELYLLPFEIAVAEAQPWSLLAAYNQVNGIPATEHDEILNRILKGEWSYDGLVIGEWFATKTTVESVTSGLDLVMPGPDGPWGDALVAAVEAGQVPVDTVDDHVARLLRLAERVGALDSRAPASTDVPAPGSALRREQLTRLAVAGMTVLTNNGVLPLEATESSRQRVALIGRHAIETLAMGGGSAQLNPPHQVSIADGLAEVLGGRLTVTDGVEVRTRPTPASPKTVTHPDDDRPAGVLAEVYAADGALIDTRSLSRSETVVGLDDDLPDRAARLVFRGRSLLAGEVEVGGIGVGRWTVRVGGESKTFALRATPGYGSELHTPPAHVVPIRLEKDAIIEVQVELDPPNGTNPLSGCGRYGFILRQVAAPTSEVLAKTERAAAAADVAVVVVGLTEEQETETVDKTTIALPGEQDALVFAAARAARRTVVLINAATPVLMPWADDVDAILWIGLPGQEAGHAVAAAMLGSLEPSGRLVTTFPAADCSAPAWQVEPVDGAVHYNEGTAIGYRGHHAGLAPAPAFWFGHGLGYSTWAYSDPMLVDDDVRVTLANTGERDSREVIQVYFDPEENDQPVRLIGWTSVDVPAGQAVTVNVATDARLFRRWDPSHNSWGNPLTSGTVLIARGLGDIRERLVWDRPGPVRPDGGPRDDPFAEPEQTCSDQYSARHVELEQES